MRCSLKILQDITKQQVTNLSLPGDTERITAANLCWTVLVFSRGWGGKDSLFITQLVQPILFPLSVLKRDQSWNPLVPTLCDILTGDQFAQAALVWITLSIRSHCVYHHIHYGRGWPGHCVEVCVSREGKGWNKWPGSEATVGQAAGLIWKDSCNYESPEELAVWRVQCVNTTLTVRKVHCPPQQSKTLSQINIFNLSGSIQHLSTKEDVLAAANMYK